MRVKCRKILNFPQFSKGEDSLHSGLESLKLISKTVFAELFAQSRIELRERFNKMCAASGVFVVLRSLILLLAKLVTD